MDVVEGQHFLRAKGHLPFGTSSFSFRPQSPGCSGGRGAGPPGLRLLAPIATAAGADVERVTAMEQAGEGRSG